MLESGVNPELCRNGNPRREVRYSQSKKLPSRRMLNISSIWPCVGRRRVFLSASNPENLVATEPLEAEVIDLEAYRQERYLRTLGKLTVEADPRLYSNDPLAPVYKIIEAGSFEAAEP